MASKYEGPERRSLLGQVSIADLVAIGTSLVTALGIGGPLLIWGGKIDARMASLEAATAKQETVQLATDARQDSVAEQLKRDFREEVRDINRKLDSLVSMLEKSQRGR